MVSTKEYLAKMKAEYQQAAAEAGRAYAIWRDADARQMRIGSEYAKAFDELRETGSTEPKG